MVNKVKLEISNLVTDRGHADANWRSRPRRVHMDMFPISTLQRVDDGLWLTGQARRHD
jgi:hypothetical protein